MAFAAHYRAGLLRFVAALAAFVKRFHEIPVQRVAGTVAFGALHVF